MITMCFTFAKHSVGALMLLSWPMEAFVLLPRARRGHQVSKFYKSHCQPQVLMHITTGDKTGNNCLTRTGKLVSSSRAWSDVLLRKRAVASVGSSGSSAASSAASLQSSDTMLFSRQGSHAPAASATSDDVIKQQLLDQGWTTVGIDIALFRVKQQNGVATLTDCSAYLQKTGTLYRRPNAPVSEVASAGSVFGHAPPPKSATPKTEFALQPETQAAKDRFIAQFKLTMISFGYQASHIEEAVQKGCLDENSCIDYISHHYRDVSPPPASAMDASAACRAGGAAAAVNPSPTSYKISADGKLLVGLIIIMHSNSPRLSLLLLFKRHDNSIAGVQRLALQNCPRAQSRPNGKEF
jgi:hypothetical protein